MLPTIMLMLQTATTQQAALVTNAPAPVAEETASTERPLRRVCRTVLDTRVGLIAKSRKGCREVAGRDDIHAR